MFTHGVPAVLTGHAFAAGQNREHGSPHSGGFTRGVFFHHPGKFVSHHDGIVVCAAPRPGNITAADAARLYRKADLSFRRFRQFPVLQDKGDCIIRLVKDHHFASVVHKSSQLFSNILFSLPVFYPIIILQ